MFAVPVAEERTTPPPDGQSKGTVIYADSVHLHGALAMAQAPNGHLLVSNTDGVNADPNQPSEIVEFTVKGQFIGELSVDATPGGAFGLSLVRLNDDKVRFAAVDDNGLPVAMEPNPELGITFLGLNRYAVCGRSRFRIAAGSRAGI